MTSLDQRAARAATEAVPSIPRDSEGPVFREPWEAQAFAMALTLHARGLFTWPEWSAALAAEIAKEAVASGKTIRQLVVEKGIFSSEDLDMILDPWELTNPGVAGGFEYEPNMREGYERPTGPVGGGG